MWNSSATYWLCHSFCTHVGGTVIDEVGTSGNGTTNNLLIEVSLGYWTGQKQYQLISSQWRVETLITIKELGSSIEIVCKEGEEEVWANTGVEQQNHPDFIHPQLAYMWCGFTCIWEMEYRRLGRTRFNKDHASWNGGCKSSVLFFSGILTMQQTTRNISEEWNLVQKRMELKSDIDK